MFFDFEAYIICAVAIKLGSALKSSNFAVTLIVVVYAEFLVLFTPHWPANTFPPVPGQRF